VTIGRREKIIEDRYYVQKIDKLLKSDAVQISAMCVRRPESKDNVTHPKGDFRGAVHTYYLDRDRVIIARIAAFN
jgi:hypothetical protein